MGVKKASFVVNTQRLATIDPDDKNKLGNKINFPKMKTNYVT